MATAVADLDNLLKGVPAGAWVAISERLHKVVAHGIDAQTVLNQARESGEQDPLLVCVPEQTAMFF
jgi:hypothetical protein